MPLESVTHVGDLVATNPSSNDPKSQGDDHLRAIKTALLNSFAGFSGSILVTGTDGGTGDDYTLTPATALPAYGSRMLVAFSPSSTNVTTAPTLNISALGDKPIKRIDGNDVVTGELVAGVTYVAQYDGTNFRLASPTQHYVDNLAFSATLPAQTGNGRKYLHTDGTSAAWWRGGDIVRRAVTTADTIGADDWSTLVDADGTFTLAFAAAAALGDGFTCYVRNNGTGDVTLDPNGSETIDGLTSFVMYPGECRLILCDGSALRSIVVKSFLKTFTASGTFTKPPGYTQIGGLLWGAGGSGAKNSTNDYVSGGGGGGCAAFAFPASVLGSTETVVIGAGGASQTTTNTAGNNGGASTFGALVSAYGGVGGKSGSTFTAAITNGGAAFFSSAINEAIGIPLGAGAPESYMAGGIGRGAINKGSVYGGGGGGGFDLGSPSSGGASVFGGAGGEAKLTTSGSAGTAPGGGGGATLTGAQSGAGARGELRIWGVI